jgi:hypothetical protein
MAFGGIRFSRWAMDVRKQEFAEIGIRAGKESGRKGMKNM